MKKRLTSALIALSGLSGLLASSQAWAHEADHHHVHFYDSLIQHLPLLGLVVAVLVVGYWLQNRRR
jgi:fatty acid-binding protein DegV